MGVTIPDLGREARQHATGRTLLDVQHIRALLAVLLTLRRSEVKAALLVGIDLTHLFSARAASPSLAKK